jgi:hypothetical protein
MSEMNKVEWNGGSGNDLDVLNTRSVIPSICTANNGPVIIFRQEAAVGINPGEAQGNSRSATGTANEVAALVAAFRCGLHCGLSSVTGSKLDSLTLGASVGRDGQE